MECEQDISIDAFSSSTDSIISNFETSLTPSSITGKNIRLSKKDVTNEDSSLTNGHVPNSSGDNSELLASITEEMEKLNSEQTTYSQNRLFFESHITNNMVSSPYETLAESLECPSFNFSRGVPSNSKMGELRQLMTEVGDAYMEWKTNEFLLDCCKVSACHMPPDLKEKVDDILYSSVVTESTHIKSQSGEIFNVLGLDDEDIKIPSLSTLEKTHFRNRVVKDVEDNLRKLNEQKNALKVMFGAHCQKSVGADTLVCKKQELEHQHQYLQQKLEKGNRLAKSVSEKMEQLQRRRQERYLALLRTTYDSLVIKKNLLITKTSVLKIKMDQLAYSNKNFTKAMNSVGDELKSSVHDLREEVTQLQHSLALYETKMNSSQEYKEIVSEYAKTMRELQHKYQTLNILNEPRDDSF